MAAEWCRDHDRRPPARVPRTLSDLGPIAQLRAGRLGRRLPQLYVGLVLYGASLALMVRGDLGLAPWDVLHSGLIQHVPITLGQAVVVMSFVVLIFWIPLRETPGIGTISNAFVVGFAADGTLWLLDRPDALAARMALTVGGVALCGLATAMYIGAQLGRGPRDGLMTGLVRRTGISIRVVRTALEVTVVLIGLLLGGVAGLGTVLFALAIGPLTQLMLPGWIVDLPDRRAGSSRVAIRVEASGATITSTVVKRSSVSHCSRSVSTRPLETGGHTSHGVKSSSTTRPPPSTRSATASTPHLGRLAGVQEQQRVGALVEQRRPVRGQDLDERVVGEDLRRRLAQLRVELGGHDPGLLAAYAGAQPGRPDAAAGAELGHRAVPGGGQHRQQPAGLVAAEGHVAGPPRDVERTVDDVRELGWVTHLPSLRRVSPLGPTVSDVETPRKPEARVGVPRSNLLPPCGACSYSSSAAARPDERPPRRGGSALHGFSPRSHRTSRSRRPRDADPSLNSVIRSSQAPSLVRSTSRNVPVAGRPRPSPTHHRLRPIHSRGARPMYDMYPDWGPASHNPENPHSHENATAALQASLDLRDNGGQRPDDN